MSIDEKRSCIDTSHESLSICTLNPRMFVLTMGSSSLNQLNVSDNTVANLFHVITFITHDVHLLAQIPLLNVAHLSITLLTQPL